jgi:hypothetical protein
MACGFQGTPVTLNGSLRSLGFDGDKFVAQSFGLPFEFCFQPFLPLGVSEDERKREKEHNTPD